MKKIVFSALAAGVIAAAGLNLRLNTQNELSDIALLNVEALAQETYNGSCKTKFEEFKEPGILVTPTGSSTGESVIHEYSCVTGTSPNCVSGSIMWFDDKCIANSVHTVDCL
jgi:hypothetical protein